VYHFINDIYIIVDVTFAFKITLKFNEKKALLYRLTVTGSVTFEEMGGFSWVTYTVAATSSGQCKN
jgi:hypothetical protein